MNLLRVHIEFDKNFVWRLFMVLVAMAIIIASAQTTFATTAATGDVVGMTLCRLVANLTGGIARGIATIAIFSVGVGLFLGKMNWGIAAVTTAGVGIIFAAPKLVAFLSGDSNNSACPTGTA